MKTTVWQKYILILQKGKVSKKRYKELQTNNTCIEGSIQAGQTTYRRLEIINIATKFYENLYCLYDYRTDSWQWKEK